MSGISTIFRTFRFFSSEFKGIILAVDSLIIFTAKYLIFIIALIAVIVTLFSGKSIRNKIIILAVLSFLLSFALAALAGNLWYNPRPFVLDQSLPLIPHEADNGFPSVHTLYAMTTAAAIFIFKRKTGILLALLAVLIGVARVMAGVHHSIDIIGGLAIAVFAVFLGWLILNWFSKIRKPALFKSHDAK